MSYKPTVTIIIPSSVESCDVQDRKLVPRKGRRKSLSEPLEVVADGKLEGEERRRSQI